MRVAGAVVTDWLEGPPVKPGKYLIETLDGRCLWGTFCTTTFSWSRSLLENIPAEQIKAHRYIDTPAAEWLGPERLGDYYGKLVTIKMINSGSGPKIRHGLNVNKNQTKGYYHIGDGCYTESNIEKFCVHELPPEPSPPAPERDVWEQEAVRIVDYVGDQADGLTWLLPREKIDSHVSERLRNVIAPLQAERDRLQHEVEQLRVQLAGVSVVAMGGTRDPATREQYGWSQSYQDVLDLRMKYEALQQENERLKQRPSEQPAEQSAVPVQRAAPKSVAAIQAETRQVRSQLEEIDSEQSEDAEAIAEAEDFANREIEKVRERVKSQSVSEPLKPEVFRVRRNGAQHKHAVYEAVRWSDGAYSVAGPSMRYMPDDFDTLFTRIE